MDTLERGRPLEIGAPAPNFTLTMVDTGRPVSLADYRGKSPLLLGLYRGLYCPFCRRAVATLGLVGDRLRPLGIETLAVIGTTLDNARLYYRHRPIRGAIAVDPALVTHRAYGLPKVETTWGVVSAMRVNPSGDRSRQRPSVAPRGGHKRRRLLRDVSGQGSTCIGGPRADGPPPGRTPLIPRPGALRRCRLPTSFDTRSDHGDNRTTTVVTHH